MQISFMAMVPALLLWRLGKWFLFRCAIEPTSESVFPCFTASWLGTMAGCMKVLAGVCKACTPRATTTSPWVLPSSAQRKVMVIPAALLQRVRCFFLNTQVSSPPHTSLMTHSPGLLLPLTSVAGHAGCPPPGLVFFSGGGPLPLASHREVSSLLSAALFSSCSCPGRIWASALTSVSMTVTPSSLPLTLL